MYSYSRQVQQRVSETPRQTPNTPHSGIINNRGEEGFQGCLENIPLGEMAALFCGKRRVGKDMCQTRFCQ